jgi:hypothetical protein
VSAELEVTGPGVSPEFAVQVLGVALGDLAGELPEDDARARALAALAELVAAARGWQRRRAEFAQAREVPRSQLPEIQRLLDALGRDPEVG